MHHTVRLFPSQDLTLRLTSELRSLRTDPFIEIVGEKPLKEGIEINFKQKSNIVSWGKDASVYLGEVNGETIKGHKFRLCVYMISNNAYKADVVTVFNPVNQIIKIEPYQILEVILSDPYFGASDVWKADYQDENRELDVGFHELGHRNVSLAQANLDDDRDISDIYHLKARTNNFWHPCCREHHHWLRFDNRMLPLVRTRPNNVYFVGNINFTGYNSESADEDLKATRSLQVWLNIKNKHAYKVAQVLGVRDFGDVSEKPDSTVFLPVVSSRKKQQHRARTHTSQSNTHRSHNHYAHGYSCWSGEGYDYNTYTVKKSIREIDVKEIMNPVLGVNCKAKSLIPAGKSGLIPYDWNDDDDDALILEAT